MEEGCRPGIDIIPASGKKGRYDRGDGRTAKVVASYVATTGRKQDTAVAAPKTFLGPNYL